jgi:phage head maturation protease
MKIEFILRESTIKDVIKQWVAAGNVDNSSKGGFVFEDADDYDIENGIIVISNDEKDYIYNISDFYRIKIT